MTDILSEIISRRIKDVEAKNIDQADLKAKHRDRSDFRPFHDALRQNRGRPAIIAEIKRGSPAKGLFAPDLEPATFAGQYALGHAACLSVLTEPHYFFGSFDDLTAARNACSLPVLQKDFIVLEDQVWECAVHADAMLLIARCLEPQQLVDLHGLATELGLDVLVEVFDEEDIDKIEPFYFPLIGINHRNLRTMSIDLERSQRYRSRFSSGQTVVAASGIKERSDIETLMSMGIQAFLVGESLSTHPNRVEFLQALTGL
ncbi:MAG: indole-3-glycerol phosphate synthase TrpC [Planctomycetaceae bacterium]|nr:indole-3-glycerol phosphate synthase TrpC [Planctomycetaceae bacterium]